MSLGKYIVIEGHDGTGKSTQVEIIRRRLKEQGIESIEFHEPQGTPIADAIRTIIKNGILTRDEMTNLLLFSAARHEIWHNYALPALEQGKWVVASRNYYSTLAYQGYGEGLDLDTILATTRIATDEHYLQPDIAVILTLDDEKIRADRIQNRGEVAVPDTFESKNSTFQLNVHEGYREIARMYNLPVIPAEQSIDDVTEAIWRIISERSLFQA